MPIIMSMKESWHLNQEKGMFMGYGDGVKGYRIWSPSERKVLLSRDVIFDESHLLHPKIEISIAGTQRCHSPQEKNVESTTKDSEKRGLYKYISYSSRR